MTPRMIDAATQKPIRMRRPFSLSTGNALLSLPMSMAHLPRRNRINSGGDVEVKSLETRSPQLFTEYALAFRFAAGFDDPGR